VSNAVLRLTLSDGVYGAISELQLQNLLTMIIIAAFAAFALITRPFLDMSEDVLDNSFRLTNLLTASVSYVTSIKVRWWRGGG
jgi:hypothetical protein